MVILGSLSAQAQTQDRVFDEGLSPSTWACILGLKGVLQAPQGSCSSQIQTWPLAVLSTHCH